MTISPHSIFRVAIPCLPLAFEWTILTDLEKLGIWGLTPVSIGVSTSSPSRFNIFPFAAAPLFGIADLNFSTSLINCTSFDSSWMFLLASSRAFSNDSAASWYIFNFMQHFPFLSYNLWAKSAGYPDSRALWTSRMHVLNSLIWKSTADL